MPATAPAVTAGELALDHVDLLGRANQPRVEALFAEQEATLVDQCKRLRFVDAVRMVEYWRCRADAETAESDAEREQRAEHFSASPTIDGSVVLSGVLGRIGGAAFVDELQRLERAQYLADERASITRTAGQRRSAALVEMARRSATAPTDGRRPRPLFTVMLGDDTFSKLCELANGTVITPTQLVPWFDSADLETVLFDTPSTVISVSHRRTFTGALRRAIEVRDRHCQHPSGCDTPASDCDLDHIVAHHAGGPTSQFNGRVECRPHNRNHDQHDHGGTPRPSRPITVLDAIRCRLRWRFLRDEGEEGENGDEDDAEDGWPRQNAGGG